MSLFETLLDMFNLTTSDSVSFVVGAVLSPAKLVGVVYGLYKAFSPGYVDPEWKKHVNHHQESDDTQHDIGL